MIITGGGISHRYSGAIGYSKNMKESKERETFIEILDYKIVPDTIRLSKDNIFYLERGFRYGDFTGGSLKENIKPLLKKDNFTEQIEKNPANGRYFEGNYLLGREGDRWRFSKMKDTIRCEIVTMVPQYDSIYKVGELLIFRKKKR